MCFIEDILIRRRMLDTTVSADRNALVSVQAAIDQFLRHATSIDCLWAGSPQSLQKLLEDTPSFENCRTELHNLRRARETLASLQSSLDIKMAALKKVFRPAALHHGLKELPDEILLSVIRHCGTNNAGREEYHPFMEHMYAKDREGIRKLSLVSRRFRDLVYSTGEFWNDLSPKMAPTKVERQLAMRGSAPLHISVTSENEAAVIGYLDQCTFLRIRPLAMNCFKRPTFSAQRAPTEASTSSDTETQSHRCLTSVHTLSVRCMPLSLATEALFSDWTFPNLRSLFISGLMPPMPQAFLQSITTLRLLGIDGGVGVSCASVLSRVLRNTHNLERLSFACEVSDLQALTSQDPVQRASLPRLSSCTMCFCLRQASNEYDAAVEEQLASVIAGVSRIIHMPNVEMLHLHFEVNRATSLDKLSVAEMFPQSESRHSRLQRLELGASQASGGIPAFPSNAFSKALQSFLPNLLERFPLTEELTLSVPFSEGFHIDETENPCIVSLLANLKTLRLNECSHMDFDSILKKAGHANAHPRPYSLLSVCDDGEHWRNSDGDGELAPREQPTYVHSLHLAPFGSCPGLPHHPPNSPFSPVAFVLPTPRRPQHPSRSSGRLADQIQPPEASAPTSESNSLPRRRHFPGVIIDGLKRARRRSTLGPTTSASTLPRETTTPQILEQEFRPKRSVTRRLSHDPGRPSSSRPNSVLGSVPSTASTSKPPAPTSPINARSQIMDQAAIVHATNAHREGSGSPSPPPPSKANLRAWWNQFKFMQRTRAAAANPGQKEFVPGYGYGPRQDDGEHPVFGAPLNESLHYASVQISTANSNGELYVWGDIPVVVAKCGLYLKENATEIEGTFRVNGSNKRMRDLQAIFERPPKYGKNLDWKKENFNMHDVASVFRRYLTMMPEPVIPYNLYAKFREPLMKEMSVDDTIKTYKQLIRSMPRHNQYLLLYVLDLLSVFARKSDINLMTATNLAVIFRPGLIDHPQHILSPTEHHTSQRVLEFLIEHQDWFMLDVPPPPPPASRGHAPYSPLPTIEDERSASPHPTVLSVNSPSEAGWRLVEKRTGSGSSSGELRHSDSISRKRGTTQRKRSNSIGEPRPTIQAGSSTSAAGSTQIRIGSANASAEGPLHGAQAVSVTRSRTLPSNRGDRAKTSRDASGSSSHLAKDGRNVLKKQQKRASMQQQRSNPLVVPAKGYGKKADVKAEGGASS